MSNLPTAKRISSSDEAYYMGLGLTINCHGIRISIILGHKCFANMPKAVWQAVGSQTLNDLMVIHNNYKTPDRLCRLVWWPKNNIDDSTVTSSRNSETE